MLVRGEGEPEGNPPRRFRDQPQRVVGRAVIGDDDLEPSFHASLSLERQQASSQVFRTLECGNQDGDVDAHGRAPPLTC